MFLSRQISGAAGGSQNTRAQEPRVPSQFQRKLALTFATAVLIACGAVLGDYVFNAVLFAHPQEFTPLTTSLIGLTVGTPIAFYLISQRIDIEAVKEQLADSMAYKERAVAEIQMRSEEAERARAEAEQALERLSENEALYRLLADNSSDVISLWSRDGHRRYTSPSAERVFGYSASDLSIQPGLEHVHAEDREKVQALLRSMTPGSAPKTLECRVIRNDGTEAWIEATFQLLNDTAGSLLSTARVISQRKQLEHELIAALDEAKTALAVKTDFLANMTHELRTPLNAIVGFSGLLKRSPDLTIGDARKVELISDASETLLRVVNDVLDFSKLEADAIELDDQPFDPRQLAETTLALLADQASAKGLTTSVTVEGQQGLLLGDDARLRQVLLNFASNAIKFTARGGVEIHVAQHPYGAARRLRVEVRDSGIGVPADQIEQIFERFTQADASVSRQYGGTGLGLAICKRIIDALGGEIGVESVMGSGSTFWFEVMLPVALALSPEAPAPVEPGVTHQALKLLVVDDNAVNRELICSLLAPFDFEVETAEDGVAAVEAASRARFDLILMDVQMPNMDGLTATRRIRADMANSGRTPIIAMTANVLPEQVARCLEAGMDDHLGKPINPHDLLLMLDRWAEQRPKTAVIVDVG